MENKSKQLQWGLCIKSMENKSMIYGNEFLFRYKLNLIVYLVGLNREFDSTETKTRLKHNLNLQVRQN